MRLCPVRHDTNTMAATAAQRLRAGRLRKRALRGTITPAERKWLGWYDNAHPAPGMPSDDALALDEQTAEPVSAPPPPPEPEPSWTPEVQAPAYVPGSAQRSSRSDIVDDAMRSAVNAQVASLEMMERTCAMLLDHARAMSASHISLTEQLVDALTMLAERVHDDVAEREAPEAPSASDAVVTQLIQRMGGNPPQQP